MGQLGAPLFRMMALASLLLGGCSSRTAASTEGLDSGTTAGSAGATGGSETAGSGSAGETTTTGGLGQLTTACGESEGDGDGPTDWLPTEGCPAAWPFSKIVETGPNSHGGITHAVFGYTLIPGNVDAYVGPDFRFFADGIDQSAPHWAIWELSTKGPKSWLGEYAATVYYQPGDSPESSYDLDVTVEICSYAGNWLAYDPDDPPRLLGQISSQGAADGLQGTFDAVFCEDLYREVPPD